MKYHVSLDGRPYQVEVDGDEVRVGGRVVRASLHAVQGTPMRLLTVDGQSVGFAVTAEGAGRWTLQHRGEAIAVEVLDERSHHIGPWSAPARPRWREPWSRPRCRGWWCGAGRTRGARGAGAGS
jgi:hypothetical protein